MSSDVAIRMQGLCKSFPVYSKPHHRLLQMFASDKQRWFREFHALRNINLTIERGETLGIVGRNGSGKSTLLQLICGTLTPTAGQVHVNGRIAALLELGAGFNPEFSGRENVFLNGTILGLTRGEIAARFDDIAAFADIGEFIEQPVKTYSSGMYVRLAFAVAINVDPEVLIIDEALSVGDEGFQRKCYARIDAIRDLGATVLFVSHSAGTVVDLCDRAILLDHGELLATGTPRQVVSRYQKLLNTPADRLDQVREQIRSAQFERDTDAHDEFQPLSGTIDEQPSQTEDQAYWQPGLMPSSTVHYERRGALIEAPQLQTLDGRRVNVLMPGGEYVYTYRVIVEQTLIGVRCGMMIRTVTGIDLGGAVSAIDHATQGTVLKGDVLRVRIRFRCLLTAGTYFLNAGVLASLSGGEEFVDRQVDVGMFRVMHVPGALSTGMVDFDVVPQVRTET